MGAPSLGQQVNSARMALALRNATPLSLPVIQQSGYLADALQKMRDQGPTIRTKGALGTNLLAEALLQFGQARQDKKLATAMQGDQNTHVGMDEGYALGGGGAPSATPAAGGDGAPAPAPMPAPASAPPGPVPPPAAAPGAMSAGAPPAATPANAVAPPQTRPAAAMPPIGSADHDHFVRAVIGEGGDSPQDEAATASVILNRSRMSGQSIADVLSAPHQFEAVDNPKAWKRLAAIDPGSPVYQQASQVADKVLSDGPVGTFDHFYSPGAQKALGRPTPAWDDGTGQDIGGQRFFSQGYGGHRPLSGGQSTASGAQPDPAPQPLQVSTGPDPSIPSPAAMGPQGPGQQPPGPQNPGPLPPGPANSAPPQGAASSQGSFAAPPVPLAPWQIENYRKLQAMARANPAFIPQLDAESERLYKQRTTPEEVDISRPTSGGQIVLTGKQTGRSWTVTPQGMVVEAGPKMRSDGQGGFTRVQGTGFSDVPGAPPGTITQRNEATGEMHSQAVANGQVSGQAWDPRTQSYRPIPGLQPQVQGQFAQGTVVSQKPGENPSIVQAPPITAEAVNQRGQAFNGSDLHKNTQHALAAFSGLSGILGKISAGGPQGMAAMDTYFKVINPGVGVRPATVQTFMEHQGIPQEIQAHILNAVGDGFMTPQTLKQMVRIGWSYGHALVQQDQDAANSNAQWAQGAGHDPRELGQNTLQMPDLPAYAADAPPPPAQRHAGMVVWTPKGPATWDGHGWVLH